MKKKALWFGLICCSLLVAGHLVASSGTTVAVKPMVKDQLVATDNPLKPVASTNVLTPATPTASVGIPVDLPANDAMSPLSAFNTAGGAKLKGNTDLSDRLNHRTVEAPATTTMNPTASLRRNSLRIDASLGGRGMERHESSLDDACVLSYGGAAASGFPAWFPGDEVKFWVDPADCGFTPTYPFHIDTVWILGADPSLFSGGGNGTVTYRINIECTADGLNDPCAGPGTAICETADIVEVYAAEGFQVFMGIVDCCVEGPFFVGWEFVDWTGTDGLTPTPLWDAVAEPACAQYIGESGTYFDGTAYFTSPMGRVIADVSGNTDDACIPIPCAAVTGACCDRATGNCADGVEQGNCTGLNEVFSEGMTCAQVGCVQCVPPANGNCANAIALTEGVDACGSGVCDLLDCAEDIEAVWYSFTLTDPCNNVTVSYCGSNSANINAYLALFDGCLCAAGTVVSPFDFNTTDCVNGQPTIFYTNVPAGTYYIGVHPDLFDDYCVQYTAEPCPDCFPDQGPVAIPCTPGTPTVLNGTTIGGDDDCNDGINEEIWEITIATEGRYTFDMCNTTPVWDAVIWISDECCGDPIASDDDGCGTTAGPSIMECVYLYAGTYYVMVEGFTATDEGAYELAVECCNFCDIVCVPALNLVAEGEACPNPNDAYNVGCGGGDANVVVNGPTLVCNADTVCGNSWTQGDTLRDIDYFELTVDADTVAITWCVTAEFPVIVQLIATDAAGTCASTVVLGGASGAACDTVCVTACVDAENTTMRYFGLVAPATFVDPPETECFEYQASASCAPCVIEFNECTDSRITGALAFYADGITGNWTWFDVDDGTELPYKPLSITFSLYYPVAGATTDTTTLLITYGCPFFGDVCNAPSDILCSGVATIVRDVATVNYLQTVDLDLSTLECCLPEDFWVGIEIVDYVGTAGAMPSYLWSNTSAETIPDCEQWSFDGAYAHWPNGSLGWQDVEITGACGGCLGDPELVCSPDATLDCTGATVIACSDVGPQLLAGQTNVGGTATANFYGCAPWDESGPEHVYVITIPQGGGVIADIDNFSPVDIDLDIFLLNACDPSACVASGDANVNAVNLSAGTYYVVVDGFAGDEGTYDLTIDLPCTPPGQCLPTVDCGDGLLDPDAILIWDGELLPGGNTAWLSQGTTVGGNDMVIKITDPNCDLVSTVDVGGASITEVGRSIAFDPRDGSWWMGTFTDATPLDALRHYSSTGTLLGTWTLADFPTLTLVPSLNIPGLAMDTDNNHLWAFTSHSSYIEWDVTNAASPVVIQEGAAAPATAGNSRSGLDYDEANDRLFSCNFVGTLGLGDIECWSDDDPASAGGVTFEDACRVQPGGITQNWGLAMSSVTDGILLANLDAVTNTDHEIWTTEAPCLASPCEVAEDLTVYLTTGGGNIILRWNAPHAEDWNVYKTIDPNNDGDITDPSYTFEATVSGGPGALSWTDPATIDSYVNYIVVPSCYQPAP